MYTLYACDDRDKSRFLLGNEGARTLHIVGLNPSTANQERGDTTVTKAERIAQANGFDGFVMTNLYPQRSTDPSVLHKRRNALLMQQNLEYITDLVSHQKCPVFWAAWGGDIETRPYLLRSLAALVRLVDAADGRWVHYGALRKDGHPRHPSRAAYRWRFSDFDIDEYVAGILGK